MNPTTSLSPTQEDQCSICLGLVENPASLNACTHSFCRQCITLWSKSKRHCPLCNKEFTSLKFQCQDRQIEEPVPIPPARQADLSTDLEALDHPYFLQEARRLLCVAEDAQRRIVLAQKQRTRSNYGSKFQSPWEERNWNLVQSVVSRLQAQIEFFKADQHLEPSVVLEELYDIQAQMDGFWQVPQQECHQHQVKEEKKKQVYSADDYDNLSSASEEEDEGVYDYEED